MPRDSASAAILYTSQTDLSRVPDVVKPCLLPMRSAALPFENLTRSTFACNRPDKVAQQEPIGIWRSRC